MPLTLPNSYPYLTLTFILEMLFMLQFIIFENYSLIFLRRLS